MAKAGNIKKWSGFLRRNHETKEVLRLTDTYNTRAITYAVRIRTITVPEEVYRGLHAKIGGGRISGFIDALARPHVVLSVLDCTLSTASKHNEAMAVLSYASVVRW